MEREIGLDGSGASPIVPSSNEKSNVDASVGTKDAPVDGKDGRPHQGPFVETSAERDRKRLKKLETTSQHQAPRSLQKGKWRRTCRRRTME